MFIRSRTVFLSLSGVLIGLVTLNVKAVIATQVCLAFLCLLDVLFAPKSSFLTLTRNAAETSKTHQPFTQELTITNWAKAKVSGSLKELWPPSAQAVGNIHEFSLTPQASANFVTTLHPQRRGTLRAEAVAVRTNGPLGLAGRQSSHPVDWTLRVLPPFHARKHLPSRIQRLRELEGRALLLVRGQGTEFDSLHEYSAGDDVRAIDWRSSARLGETLVRTWRPERDRKVVIILDSGRAGALRLSDFPAFDTYLESAFLTAALAQRAGDQVDVFALDSQIRGRVNQGRGEQLIHKIAQKMADVEPVLAFTDWQLAQHEIEKSAKQASLVVLLTSFGVGTISDGLLQTLPALTRKQQVLVAAIDETKLHISNSATNSQNQIYLQTTQERAKLEKIAIAKTVRRLGAHLVTANSENLPTAVADTYLELKACGKL